MSERAATAEAAAPGARRGRQWLVAALATLMFAALLARETSAAEIVARLRALPATALLGALASLALAGVARAVRLQLLLPSRLGLGDAYAFNQIYNVVTATVPTGLGEAASAWLMRRALRVPLHLGLVALFAGRFLDLVVLLALFLALVLGGGVELGSGSGAVVLAAAGLLALLTVVGLVHQLGRSRATALLVRTAERVGAATAVRRVARRALRLLAEALELIPDGRPALVLLVLTLVMQVVSLGALASLLSGAGHALGFAAITACFVTYVLLRMIPFQGIAGIGTTAAWWAIALSMLGVPAREAATLGAVLYVAFYALLLVLCALCLPLLLVRRSQR